MLPPIDRLGLCDDLFSQALSGILPYHRALQILPHFEDEVRFVWACQSLSLSLSSGVCADVTLLRLGDHRTICWC